MKCIVFRYKENGKHKTRVCLKTYWYRIHYNKDINILALIHESFSLYLKTIHFIYLMFLVLVSNCRPFLKRAHYSIFGNLLANNCCFFSDEHKMSPIIIEHKCRNNRKCNKNQQNSL
jgi:hypothetical protein